MVKKISISAYFVWIVTPFITGLFYGFIPFLLTALCGLAAVTFVVSGISIGDIKLKGYVEKETEDDE
jgi:hypothetical protein